jgi:NarL family two-component system response regulator YdfI
VTRVLVVAQSPVVRAGLEALLNGTSAVEVIGSVATVAEYSGEDPDVILADTQNEDDPARELIDNPPSAPLVLFADDVGFVAETFRSGVRAVLPRQADASQIVAALEAAAAGFVLLHPSDLDGLLVSPRPATMAEPLTHREIEVLGMLAEGHSNKGIAHRLSISEHTVKFHVTSILGKLNAASRTEAVTLGIRQGLIML